MAELQKLGVRSVPVLSRGDKFTFGQSTKQIVDFLGLHEKSGPRALDRRTGGAGRQVHGRRARADPADAGTTGWTPTCRAGRAATARWPSICSASSTAFLDANEGITLVQAMFREEPAPDAGTDGPGGLRREGARSASGDWWRKGDTAPAKSLQTYYGPQSLHELMERTTWHSGQHVRQYMMLLEKEGVSHHRPLVAGDFAKLPMPQNVWDG